MKSPWFDDQPRNEPFGTALTKRGGISPEESPMRHAKVGDLMSLVSVLFDQQLVYGIHY